MLKSFFNKVADLQACNFIKNGLQYRCFPVNFVKFLRTPTFKNICEQLLLHLKYYTPAKNIAEPVAEYSKQQQQEEEIEFEIEAFFFLESFKTRLTVC